jgi:hypothetical protein
MFLMKKQQIHRNKIVCCVESLFNDRRSGNRSWFRIRISLGIETKFEKPSWSESPLKGIIYKKKTKKKCLIGMYGSFCSAENIYIFLN